MTNIALLRYCTHITLPSDIYVSLLLVVYANKKKKKKKKEF